MNEKDVNPQVDPRTDEKQPDISVNQYGSTKDAAVVVDEADRTVLLTPEETLVFEKERAIDIVPKTRPRQVYAGMWGRNEIATVTLGIFALLVVAIVYFFVVVPSNRELDRHRSEAQTLEYDKVTADTRFGDITTTEAQVEKLLTSEENFEANYLPPIASGRNDLYQRLNGLIAAYGLINTAGPDYASLDIREENVTEQEQQTDRSRERFRSLFPGIYVSMTVEGSYQNLRRFIKELESGRDFVVVSAVQLAPSENTNRSEQTSAPAAAPQQEVQPPIVNYPVRPNVNPRFTLQTQPQPVPENNLRSAQDRGRTRGELVSLHLEMAAYFRRPDFVSVATQ